MGIEIWNMHSQGDIMTAGSHRKRGERVAERGQDRTFTQRRQRSAVPRLPSVAPRPLKAQKQRAAKSRIKRDGREEKSNMAERQTEAEQLVCSGEWWRIVRVESTD